MVTADSSVFRRKVRHRLRLCVQQGRHVPLIHQGEVVLELKTELEPRLLIVVVLDRFRSKFQDFCDVFVVISQLRYHARSERSRPCRKQFPIHRRVSEAESFVDSRRTNRQRQEVQESLQVTDNVSTTVKLGKPQLKIRRVGEGSWRAASSAGSRGEKRSERHFDVRARMRRQSEPLCAGVS